MSITVNGTTINSLNVGNTQVKKVLVRQNASSGYTTVYFVETYEEDISVSGTTRNSGFDYPDGIWYLTPPVTHTITSASGTVKVISAEGTTTGVVDVTIVGASIQVTLRGRSPRATAVGTVKVTYEVCFSDIPTNNVVQVSSTASQQFKLNSNGYYESQCKGINNGWSLCKVEFNVAGSYTFQCINNGESNYDFGILSTINNTLQSSNKVDTTNVKKSFKGSSSTSVQSVSYSDVKVGDYIYVKYRKDGSVNNGNDSLKFKVV